MWQKIIHAFYVLYSDRTRGFDQSEYTQGLSLLFYKNQ